MQEESWIRHLRGIWEASRKHLETSGRHLEASVSIWEASERHLGGSGKSLGGLWKVSGPQRWIGRKM